MKVTKIKQNFGPIHLKNRNHGENQPFAAKGKEIIPMLIPNYSRERKVKDSPNRGKTVMIGDSQLHRIEETELSDRYVKTLVRSKCGLKIKDVDNKYQSILEEDVQQVIFHVGVNNIMTMNRPYKENIRNWMKVYRFVF